MSNNRYLEVCSAFRDRSRFPNPASFEIPISQTGRNLATTAVDPVSLAMPINSWTCNNLSINVNNVYKLTAVVEPKTTMLSAISNTTTFIIDSTNRLQQQLNYYVGATIEDVAFSNRRTIKSYRFLGSFSTYDRAEITVSASFPETFVPTNQVAIYDATDLSNTSYPLFWIPDGTNREDAYVNYILYNETLNDYRNIANYESINYMLQLDTTTGTNTPVSDWEVTHNYSLRKERPLYPEQLQTNPVITASTSATIQLNIPNLSIDNTKFIRIVPPIYNFPLTAPYNESRRIVSYDGTTISVFPNFTALPPVGAKIEILNFSYDNMCPFVYTGSLTSQQEFVCYEIELLSLLLPTETLASSEGGYISYYPYVYVELSCVDNRQRNIIYSNNPNSTRALFRVPVFDIQDNPVFTKIGGGMSQTLKFKPNSSLFFQVLLPDGELFETMLPEQFSPSTPEPRIQVSAMFSMKRLV